MSEVVLMLGNIISETPEVQGSSEPVKESEVEEGPSEEIESGKQENNFWRRVVEFREMVCFRNKSIGKFDWKNWTPGVIRTR